MEHYNYFSEPKLCEHCVYCEMYNKEDALCSYKEKWVNHTWAIYCEFFIQDGGSNE